MKNNKVIILVLMSCLSLFGCKDSKPAVQITLDDIKRYDTRDYTVYMYGLAEIDQGKAGRGVVWDFSNLVDRLIIGPTLEITNDSVACDKTPYRDRFPQANECFISTSKMDNQQSIHHYYQIRDKFYGRVTILDGKEYMESCDILKQGSYPLAYGKKYYTTVSCNDSDDGKKDIIFAEEVDGEGLLILPSGERFDNILRIKEETIENQSQSTNYIYVSKDKGNILYLKDDSIMQVRRDMVK